MHHSQNEGCEADWPINNSLIAIMSVVGSPLQCTHHLSSELPWQRSSHHLIISRSHTHTQHPLTSYLLKRKKKKDKSCQVLYYDKKGHSAIISSPKHTDIILQYQKQCCYKGVERVSAACLPASYHSNATQHTLLSTNAPTTTLQNIAKLTTLTQQFV